MRVLLSILITSLLLTGSIRAQQAIPVDSVQKVLNALPDTARLAYLKDLTGQSIQNVISIGYARLLEAEALRQQKDEYLADAWYTYAKNYYVSDDDSMRYWIAKAEPLFIKIGRFEDLCRMVGWSAYVYTRNGDKEKAVETIEYLRKLSKELPFPEGLEMADQAMADVYFSIKMFDVGKELYLNVLARMEKRDAPVIKRLNILRQLFNKLPVAKERIDYLRKAEELINQCKAAGITHLSDDSFVSDWDYTIQRYYAREYLVDNNLPEAWIHLQRAQTLSEEYQISRSRSELPQMYSMYYMATGDYNKALEYVNITEKWYRGRSLVSLYTALRAKASIFNKQGRGEEVIPIYEEMLALKDSINQESFNTQLADLRTRYEVEKLEIENQQIEAQAEQARFQATLLIVGCVVMLGIILLLIYLYRLSQRSKRSFKLAKEKAEEADHMKSAFLANMNHEIRTPLNAIVGFSQVLVEEDDKENRREFAEIIQTNNELLQQLIGDVLDISKIESNSMQLFYSPQDLPTLMKDIYQMIRLRMSAEVHLLLDPCKPYVLSTDRNRLVQVLTNLLTNAIKHTSHGQIRFGYTLNEETVDFYVEDTGEGIHEDQLESIFNRFVQLENGQKGVGLGLAICRGLISKMNGRIWATSILGEGATFHVEVPQMKP